MHWPCVCVCVYVCVSVLHKLQFYQNGLNTSPSKQHHMVAHGLLVF